MLSSSALKYKIAVKPSLMAAMITFLLYFILLSLSLLLVHFNVLSFFCYVVLLALAFKGAQQAHQQTYQLVISESGLIEVDDTKNRYSARLNQKSFYNRWFIVLRLDINNPLDINGGKEKFITLYQDAISQTDYRLLARLIHSGRD